MYGQELKKTKKVRRHREVGFPVAVAISNIWFGRGYKQLQLLGKAISKLLAEAISNGMLCCEKVTCD